MIKSDNPAKKVITNLFHDQSGIFISNIEPKSNEEITVRLRAKKGNVTKAFVQFSNDGIEWKSNPMTFEKVDKTGTWDYFVGKIDGQQKMFKYRFYCENDNPDNSVYYARTYVGPEPQTFTEKPFITDNCWCLIPDYHTPEWCRGTIWYSAMPDAYYNGDVVRDELTSGENTAVSWNIIHHFLQDKYGGDIRGIAKKLDHIKNVVGADDVAFNPIFKATQNAGYGPEYYNEIENSMGDARTFIEFAKEVHKRGMHYMIDIVFGFNTLRSVYYNKEMTYPFPAAAQDWNNKYHEFFMFTGEEGDTTKFVSSWGGVSLNHDSELLADILYRNKDSYLQYYCPEPFNVDAIRYDTGGALYGVDKDGKRFGDPHVVSKMRPYLKAINPDLMMLSEYSDYSSVDSGTWDSRWNLEFVKFIQKYINGECNESKLLDRFDNELLNIPRSYGLCEYNALSDHDMPRNHNKLPYAMRAAQIIHMTMLGSPCIYYGDEINIHREAGSFYSMEWDESNWDYTCLNFHKALCEMRKTFTCLKTGGIKFISVDDENHIFAYSRFDENSTVVAIASRNGHPVKFSVDARDLEDLDGTVYTDYLSGKQYVVKDGVIDIYVPAGGTIIAKGTVSANFKGGYEISKLGNADAQILLTDDNAFEVKSNANLGEFVFINKDIFNTAKVTARFMGKAGDRAVLVRAGLDVKDAFVAAGVNDGRLYVASRKVCGGAVKKTYICDLERDTYVRIVRDSYNNFKVLTTKIPGSVWEEQASVYAEIPNHAKAGFAVLRGKVTLENIKVDFDKQVVLCDDFRHGKSAMFDFTPSMNLKFTKQGLTITPDNHTELLTNSCDEDWTLKTCMKFVSEGDSCAGLISRQDDENCVVAGRRIENGKPVFFLGRANAGVLLTYYTAPDTNPNKKATIQLQRIGTKYSAVYSYNNGTTWHLIGKGIDANYCVERVGLVADGKAATFDHVTFGEALEDGVSFNTPKTPVKLDYDASYMNIVANSPAYSVVCGDWDMANEGYIQKSTDLGMMGIDRKTFKDFKVEATYLIDSGKGFVGFEFAKKSFDSPFGDGVLFSYDTDGNVKLSKGDNLLHSIKLNGGYGVSQRLTVELKDGVLTVFADQEGRPVLHVPFESERGAIAYVTKGVVGHINNDYVANADSVFNYNNPYKLNDDGSFTSNATWEWNRSFITLAGVAVTNYVATVTIKMKESSYNKNEQMAGIYVSAPECKFVKGKSIGVIVDGNRKVSVRDGVELTDKSAFLPKDNEYVRIMIVKQGREYRVYLDGAKEPKFTFTADTVNGGTVSIYSSKCVPTYKDFAVNELYKNTMLESTPIYKNWMK